MWWCDVNCRSVAGVLRQVRRHLRVHDNARPRHATFQVCMHCIVMHSKWSNYVGAWGVLTPERRGGPHEISGLRGYTRGPVKGLHEITDQYMIATYAPMLMLIAAQNVTSGASMGPQKQISTLAVARRILRPLIYFAMTNGYSNYVICYYRWLNASIYTNERKNAWNYNANKS